MSKYNNYVPQPLAVYKEMFAGDRSNHNYKLCQCKGDLSTWRLPLLTNSFESSLKVPVFHIKRDHRAATVTGITLKSTDGSVSFALSGWAETYNDLDDPVTLDAIVFFPQEFTNIQGGSGDEGLLVSEKYFYLVITDGVETWYTEVFTAEKPSADNPDFPGGCDLNCAYINLLWSNPNCIISQTIHNNSGGFSLFLPVNIAQPQYNYKPEQEEDGEGGSVTTFQRLDKRWEFFVRAPEYIADALTSVQMFSNVTIDFPNGDFVACRDVEVEVEWDSPCFANITFRFSAEFLAKTACC